MWDRVDAIWASPEVVILREAAGEALIVFCVTFVCMVGVFKLAERSVDLGLPVRGKREMGDARDERERGPVARQHPAATRGEPHDERSPAARARPESHSASKPTKSLQNTTSAPPMKVTGKGSLSASRHSASCGAIDEMRRSSARDAQQYLAATGARRREPHDERSPAARARPESHTASIKSKGALSGMRHSASCGAIDEMRHGSSRGSVGGMRHSSSSGSICHAGAPILQRNKWSTSSLDSIVEVSSDGASEQSGSLGSCRSRPWVEDDKFRRAKAPSAKDHHPAQAHQVASRARRTVCADMQSISSVLAARWGVQTHVVT